MLICTIKAGTIKTLIILLIVTFTTATITGFVSAAIPEKEKEQKEVRLPIIMYHSVLKDTRHSGKYVVTPTEVENDFKYLKDNGYTAILSDELIAYAQNGATLPEKPIMITFDDGYLNNVTNVLPLLEKYDLKAVISVVGSYTEKYSQTEDHNPNYSHFNYDDIKLIAESGRVEIANHSYDLHSLNGRSGCSIIKGEDIAQYQQMLKADLSKTQTLLSENVGITPVIFTYPYGSCCESSKPVVKDLGFKISLGCGERVNIISRNPDSLYNLGRFNRESQVSTQNFMKRLEK